MCYNRSITLYPRETAMPNRAAVVIGINYDSLPPGVHPDATKSAGINRLHYAEADARAVAALLTDAGYDVKLLTGAAATQRAIVNTIVQQRRAAGPEGFLLIHFSGHGDVDPDDPQTAYLLPADTDPDALAASGVALDYLVQRYLSGVKSALALLDCCHSGYALGWKSGEDTGERGRAFLAQAEATFNHAHGRVVLAACAGAARTRELGELEHGAFTYYLLNHWRNQHDEVSVDTLFVNIDKGLESKGLPRPVRGGTQEGRLMLRAPLSELRAKPVTPVVSLSEIDQRQKLYLDISQFNQAGWAFLLYALGMNTEDLLGSKSAANIRNLISGMSRKNQLGILAQAVDEAKQHRKLCDSIGELNDSRWKALLTAVEFDERELTGSTRSDKTHILVREMADMGLLGILEGTVREQALPQIRELLSQLIEAETQQNWDQVIDFGERILKLDVQHEPARSKTALAYNERGASYHNKKEYSSAIADYTRAIDLAPQEAVYPRNRGVSYDSKGDYDRAIADKSRAIELAPQRTAYYWQRGVSFHLKGEYDRAIADYNFAIELDAQQAAYYYSRGMSHDSKGDYDRAIADKSHAIELDPQQAAYWQQRGVSYDWQGQYDQAIADYTQAIDLASQEPLYYMNRGVSYHLKGDYRHAIADFNLAIELAPEEAKYYYDRGLAYKATGNREAARRDFQRAIELGYTQARQELAEL
jgi:tetratricopeptide (TPR) repeat protein